jgi:hypothetical protein
MERYFVNIKSLHGASNEDVLACHSARETASLMNFKPPKEKAHDNL